MAKLATEVSFRVARSLSVFELSTEDHYASPFFTLTAIAR